MNLENIKKEHLRIKNGIADGSIKIIHYSVEDFLTTFTRNREDK